jgi:hypothetical protein
MVKMGGPYLERGETIVLTTDRVRFNALQHDVLLTTRNLILVDAGQDRFQPSMYPLLSILSVKGGKTANGESVISIFFHETEGRDDSEPMILVFSQQPGEQRKSERDDWMRKLMKLIVSARQETSMEGSSPADQKDGIQPSTRRTFAPDMPIPFKTAPDTRPDHVEFTLMPEEPEPPVSSEDAESDMIPATHQEEETPYDAGFIPVPALAEAPAVNDNGELPADAELVPESPVTGPSAHHNGGDIPRDAEWVRDSSVTGPHSDESELRPVEYGVPESPGISVPPVWDSEESSGDIEPAPDTAVASLTSSPDSGWAPVDTGRLPESPDTPFTPFTDNEGLAENAGLVPDLPEPEKIPEIPKTEPLAHTWEGGEGSVSVPDTSTEEESPDVPGEDTRIADLPLPPEQEGSGSLQNSYEKEPELSESTLLGMPEVQETFHQTAAETTTPAPEIPRRAPDPGSGWRTFIAVTAILIIILAIVGAGVYYSASFPPQPVTTAPTPTTPMPSLTLQPTPVPTSVIIPPNGIWVRVMYHGDFYGWLGIAGSLRAVNSSGEQIYKLPESAETIQVNMYKPDNSGKPLLVEVYREGKMISNRTISVPMGSIEMLIDAKTGMPPGLSPAITPQVNQTGSGGGRIMYF